MSRLLAPSSPREVPATTGLRRLGEAVKGLGGCVCPALKRWYTGTSGEQEYKSMRCADGRLQLFPVANEVERDSIKMPQLGSRKSRKGCKRCKQRRVKCDERVPCTGCVRRNEQCSFLEPSPSASSEATADPTLPPDGDDWILDL